MLATSEARPQRHRAAEESRGSAAAGSGCGRRGESPLRILRALFAALGGLVVLAVAGTALFAALRLATHEPLLDRRHLDEKHRYLASLEARARPNLVLILFDDLGWGDLGAYGCRAIATPRIDRLAAEGARLTDYHAPAPFCTPSRAGLLTGRYPPRTGLVQVTFPHGSPLDLLMRIAHLPTGMPEDEVLLPEVLRAAGYATAMVGKWHLGGRSPSLPTELGFDRYFGLLFSNDMAPVPLWRDREIAEPHPVDQSTLTERYTDEAIAFLEENRGRPFFLYLAHTFPHVPLLPSAVQRGDSEGGIYGDVIEDLDRSTGRLLDALARLGLEDDTLVIVTSDNGPWFEGSPGSVRGRKNESFEGGTRVPFIARWPGRIPAGGVIGEPVNGIDVLPTMLGLTGIGPPPDRVLDGRDMWPVLAEGARSPHEALYSYRGARLEAVRVGRYKAHSRHGVFGGSPGDLPFAGLFPKGPWLFDLDRDPSESYDVSERQPEVAARLFALIEARDAEMERNPRGWRE